MTDKPLKIFTLKDSNSAEFKEKSSVFISFAFPLKNEEEFPVKMSEIKKEHYKARHLCFAYRLPGLVKYSDAGEPSGTAGIRILNAIDHLDLQNTAVIVVRYFGGVKLGVGPLGKAYYTAALESLKSSEVAERNLYVQVKINSPLTEQHLVFSVLTRAGVTDIRTNFSDECIFDVLIKKVDYSKIVKLFGDHYMIKLAAMDEVYI